MVLIIVYSVVLLLLLILSMFFSSADMAYGSASLNRISKLQDDNPKKKKFARAYKLSKNYDKTISTILLFNDTINAGLDTVATLLGIQIALQVGITNNDTSELYGLVASLIVLVLKVIFGEMIAKSLGKIYNYKAVGAYSFIIQLCYWITIPITFLVGGFGHIVAYPFIHSKNDIQVKDEELHEMVDEIEEEGVIDEDKADILRGTIDYATTEVYEIMTPRAKLCAIEKETTIEEIMENNRIFSFSRILIYEENIDNIIGYVETKSLIKASLENNESIPSNSIKEIKFVPRTTEINDVLNYFIETHHHMVIVLDEYGGVEGLVTKEDIYEELVGEIWDETDQTNNIVSEQDEDTFIIDGGMNLEDFCQLFDLDFDEIDTEYVTIGGFIIELLDDKFAELNQVIEYQNLSMKVIAMGKHHTIKKLLVKKMKDKNEKE